jgi:hypothetical protein
MEFNELKKLASIAARADRNAPVAYSVSKDESYTLAQVNEAIAKELSGIAYDYRSFRDNASQMFRLVEETIDEVIPTRVMQQFEQFAEIKNVANGDKAVYKVRITEAAKQRAKTFVTRVADAGRYETFMLDGAEFEVKTGAVGYAVRVTFEDILTGRWQFSDFVDLAVEGLDEWIYQEIANQLEQAVANLPSVNKVEVAGFDEQAMDNILAIADSYGPASIYCTMEFAAKMVPASGWVSNGMKDTLWNTGYLANYKGHNVVILPQSMTDETNTVKVVDPAQAYIMPSGQDTRPVKVVFEGETHVRTVDNNDDWSQDIQCFKKVGVGVLWSNHWVCSYRNTDLKKTVNE